MTKARAFIYFIRFVAVEMNIQQPPQRKTKFIHYAFVVAVNVTWIWFLFLFTQSQPSLFSDRVIIATVVCIVSNTLISALLLSYDQPIETTGINMLVFLTHLFMDYGILLLNASKSLSPYISVSTLFMISCFIMSFTLMLGIYCMGTSELARHHN